MKILARRGENVYLVQLDHDLGQILDLNLRRLFPPASLNSILSRGYWNQYDGPPEELDQLMAKVQDRGPLSFQEFEGVDN